MNSCKKKYLAWIALAIGATGAVADCLKNQTVKCCDYMTDGALDKTRKCGTESCPDLAISDPDLDFVVVGDRKPTMWVSPQPVDVCKFMMRYCHPTTNTCVSQLEDSAACNGSKFTASHACPP
jgi:hypothetical protein